MKTENMQTQRFLPKRMKVRQSHSPRCLQTDFCISDNYVHNCIL